MIVIAVIGVLNVIALLIYQMYVAKSQLTAVVAELNGTKAQYECILNHSSTSDIDDFTVPNLFFGC